MLTDLLGRGTPQGTPQALPYTWINKEAQLVAKPAARTEGEPAGPSRDG